MRTTPMSRTMALERNAWTSCCTGPSRGCLEATTPIENTTDPTPKSIYPQLQTLGGRYKGRPPRLRFCEPPWENFEIDRKDSNTRNRHHPAPIRRQKGIKRPRRRRDIPRLGPPMLCGSAWFGSGEGGLQVEVDGRREQQNV